MDEAIASEEEGEGYNNLPPMSGMAGMAGMGVPPMMMPGGMPMMGGGGEQCCKCIMANTPNSWQNVHCLPCMYHCSLLKWHYSIVIHVTANFGNSSMMNVLVYKLISSTMQQLLQSLLCALVNCFQFDVC